MADIAAVEGLEGMYPEPLSDLDIATAAETDVKVEAPDSVYKNDRLVTMGRIVRYTMIDGSGERVAIVTKVRSQLCVNLFIFMDASDDYNRGFESILDPSVMFGPEPGQWHWPVREN